jgi:hypothetical protein
MADTSTMTAAPADVELSGKTYRMSPLAERDLGEFEQWARCRIIDEGRDAARRTDDPEEKQMLITAGMREAAKLHIGSSTCQAIGRSPDGLKRQVWYSLRHEHPKMTFAEAAKLLAEGDNFERALERLGDLQPSKKRPDPVPASNQPETT